MLKFHKNNDDNYEIDFFMDVSLLTIKKLTTKFGLSRMDMDGCYIKENEKWMFRDRTNPNIKIRSLNYSEIGKLDKFLDDELKQYIRREKLKKLNESIL